MGNSIIYADLGVHAAYLIPFFFYKSVDHTLNAGMDNQNSQMFLDISSRNIRKIHLYGTMFIDELAISRMRDPNQHSNFWSWKLGGRINNYPIDNVSGTFEFTRSNPLTYRHPTAQLTYESNRYNLGHYLTGNALEYYVSVDYRPIKGLLVDLSYLWARKGPDYTELGGSRLGVPFMETVEWENKSLSFNIRYQLLNDLYVFGNYRYSNITGDVDKYTHPLWHGKTNTLSAGLNFGF